VTALAANWNVGAQSCFVNRGGRRRVWHEVA